jgi:hypothetical protein
MSVILVVLATLFGSPEKSATPATPKVAKACMPTPCCDCPPCPLCPDEPACCADETVHPSRSR